MEKYRRDCSNRIQNTNICNLISVITRTYIIQQRFVSGNVDSKLESNIHLPQTVIQWFFRCAVSSNKHTVGCWCILLGTLFPWHSPPQLSSVFHQSSRSSHSIPHENECLDRNQNKSKINDPYLLSEHDHQVILEKI